MRALKMLGSDDCFRTVIACLLDCADPSEVPHVFDHSNDDVNIGFELIRLWLKERGLGLAVFGSSDDLSDILEMMGSTNPDVHWMLIGSNRNGVNHAVVCLGDQQVHDPAWGGTGIHSPGDLGHYMIGVIVRL